MMVNEQSSMNKVVTLLCGIVLAVHLLCGVAFSQFSDKEKEIVTSGIEFLQQGEMDKALSEFDRALKLNPKNYSAYFYRGLVKFLKYDHQGSLDDYTKAIELAPKAKNIERAYSNRGNTYFFLKKFDNALMDYDKAIALNPAFVDPYVGRGNILLNRGEADKALRDYDKAIELDPKATAAYVGRADVRFERGQLDLALSDLNKSLELQPNIAGSHLKRGATYGLLGKWQLAITDISRAAEINAASKSPYWGNVAVTLSDIDKFIERNATNAKGFAVRGIIYFFRDMEPESQRDFAKGFQLEPALHKELDEPLESFKKTTQE